MKYFVKQLSRFSGLKEREFSDEAIAALQAYYWPGNVRQLRNVIEWTLIMNPLASGVIERIKSDMLPQDIISNSVNIPKPDNNLEKFLNFVKNNNNKTPNQSIQEETNPISTAKGQGVQPCLKMIPKLQLHIIKSKLKNEQL